MLHPVVQRIFAVGLLLSRLVLADGLPAPQLSPGAPIAAADFTAAPCPMHAHKAPASGGSCCKYAQCPCVHAPALAIAVQAPLLGGTDQLPLTPRSVQRANTRAAMFFRPPILQDSPAS